MKKIALTLILIALAVPVHAKPSLCGPFDCMDVVIKKVPKHKFEQEKAVKVVRQGKPMNRKAFCKAFICSDVYVVSR